MNYREFTERVYNYKHGLTNSAESQNIQHSSDESIEHSSKGDSWDQHKYIRKEYLGNGNWKYIYEDGSSHVSTGANEREADAREDADYIKRTTPNVSQAQQGREGAATQSINNAKYGPGLKQAQQGREFAAEKSIYNAKNPDVNEAQKGRDLDALKSQRNAAYGPGLKQAQQGRQADIFSVPGNKGVRNQLNEERLKDAQQGRAEAINNAPNNVATTNESAKQETNSSPQIIYGLAQGLLHDYIKENYGDTQNYGDLYGKDQKYTQMVDALTTAHSKVEPGSENYYPRLIAEAEALLSGTSSGTDYNEEVQKVENTNISGNSKNVEASTTPAQDSSKVDTSVYDPDVKTFGDSHGKTSADVMQAYKRGGVSEAANAFLDSDQGKEFANAARMIADKRSLSDDEIFDINTYKNFYGSSSISDNWMQILFEPAINAKEYMSGDEYDEFANQIEEVLRTIVNNQGINDYYKNKN